MNNFDIKNKNLYNQKVQNTTAVVDNQAPDRMLSLTTNTFFFPNPEVLFSKSKHEGGAYLTHNSTAFFS